MYVVLLLCVCYPTVSLTRLVGCVFPATPFYLCRILYSPATMRVPSVWLSTNSNAGFPYMGVKCP